MKTAFISLLVLTWINLMPITASAATERAKAFYNLFLNERQLTATYLSGFAANRNAQFESFYKKHSEEINKIITENYSEPLMLFATETLESKLSAKELEELIKFYTTETGIKTMALLKQKPVKDLKDQFTKALAEINRFHSSGAGKKWNNALKVIKGPISNPNNIYAKNTLEKLLEFYKKNSAK